MNPGGTIRAARGRGSVLPPSPSRHRSHARLGRLGPGLLGFCLLVTGCATTGSDGTDPAKVAELNTQLALEYYREQNYVPAVRKLDKALEADSRYPQAHTVGGLLYEALGETDKADQFYRRAIELDPRNVVTLNNYGQFLCARGRWQEGLSMFQRAIDEPLNQSPLVSFNNAGQCAFASGDIAQAGTYLREALAFDPELPPALLTMARVSLLTDRSLSARAYLQRFEAVAPHNASTLAAAIEIETALGDSERATSYMNRLRREFPDSPEAAALPDRRPSIQPPTRPSM